MAKPFSKNAKDNEHGSFTADKNGDAARNVVDIQSHELLDAINTALGGSTDTTVAIYNLSTTAGIEDSQALPVNCKGFLIRSRGKSKTQVAFTSGQTNTAFLTIWPGSTYEDKNFFQSQTIYFQTSKDDTLELIAFS